MATWIILLRGVNVGGKNKLPMKDLRASLADAGCTDVETYVQSGNVVLDGKQRSAAAVERLVADAIEQDFGFRPAVLALNRAEFGQAIQGNPFPKAEADPKSLHLFFLARKPTQPDLAGIAAKQAKTERFELAGRVFYLHAPDGLGKSKVAAAAERLLGVDATARNWRTVSELAALAAR